LTKRREVLERAIKLVEDERPGEHGDFKDNVSDMIVIMSVLTGRSFNRHDIHSFLLALKLCRTKDREWSEDGLTDLAGYAALVAEDQENG